MRRANVLSGLAGFLCLPAFAASADVFINEIHYDNAGSDSGERVEVLAPSGTNLGGWTLALYNGSNGARYATVSLSGTVADQCNGFGTVVANVAGIQNGGPDGIALVDASGNVVQFLSYEGSFSASDGPASGQASEAITQSETSGTASGTSLQLAGSGNQYGDFSWQASAANTFGACNTGQTLTGGGGGDGGGGGSVLANGVPVTGLAAGSGNALAYTIEVPAGATNLHIASSGGSGDADLYVRHGQAPTTSTWDCRPYLYGNDEHCDFAAPAAGTWHVMLRAYASFSGASLVAGFSPPSGGGGGGGGDDGYYDGVNASSASALRASLHALIDDHTKVPYTASVTDTWDALEFADQDLDDPSSIADIYRNAPYLKEGGGNDHYNREHTWPNSLGFPDDGPTNFAYTDLHMLMLSDIAYNSDRGNLPYGNCNAWCTEYPTVANDGRGGGSGTFPGNSNWSDGNVWQAWQGVKGNVARAILYMDVRYEGGSNGDTGTTEPDLRLTDNASLIAGTGGNASIGYMGLLSVLLQWHQQDPVDQAERLRNEAIQTWQGNRNPFVDHPEWAACVYQGACP
ncbi:MAG: endonuclease [Pseudomonadota bacterium]|nr:endonuclease [Pseudomonadota bacterium]